MTREIGCSPQRRALQNYNRPVEQRYPGLPNRTYKSGNTDESEGKHGLVTLGKHY